MANNQNVENLNDKQLEQIAGGGTKEQVAAGILCVSALVGGSIIAAKLLSKSSCGGGPCIGISQKIEQPTLFEFLKDAKISKAQEEAFVETNNLALRFPNHAIITEHVSSDRYRQERATHLEEILDKGVRQGDLPIQNFSMAAMQKAKEHARPASNNDVKFVLYLNSDAMTMHERNEVEDGSVVNLASQFNALESPSCEPTAVKYWPKDRTQGPYCALQSVAGTKHREAAHLQGKLPDALQRFLNRCKIDGRPITEKYPRLYNNGYLELMEIDNEQDMNAFLSFLNDDLALMNNMKVLMQWVKCEGTGKKQLQFFTAAPSFQSYYSSIWTCKDNWTCKKNLTNLRKQACVRLIDVQYRALAQAAAVRSVATGRNVKLHVAMIGHGAFNNPDETVAAALNALKEELKGYNVTVFLHTRPGDTNTWLKGRKTAGINWEIQYR